MPFNAGYGMLIHTKSRRTFSFNRSYDVSGQKTAHIHHHDIVIPANATAGDYHLMVYCTDAAGNESYIARNIKLSNEVEDEDHHHNE